MNRECVHTKSIKVHHCWAATIGREHSDTATHCNTLQHTATLWGGNDSQAAPSVQHERDLPLRGGRSRSWALLCCSVFIWFVGAVSLSRSCQLCTSDPYDTLQHTATHCSCRLCVTDSDLNQLDEHKTTLQHTTDMRYLLVHKAITSSACARQDITYLQCVAVPSCAQVCSGVIFCVAVSFCAPQHKMTLQHTCAQDFTATRWRCVISCRAQEALVLSLLVHSVGFCTSVLQCQLMFQLQCTQ